MDSSVDNKTIIIPDKAVTSDENNIASYEPFQMPNGSISKYKEIFQNIEASNLFGIFLKMVDIQL